MGKCLVCERKLGAKQYYCSTKCEQVVIQDNVRLIYKLQKAAGII